MAVAGVTGRARWGRTILISSLCALTATFLVAAVGYVMQQPDPDLALIVPFLPTPQAIAPL